MIGAELDWLYGLGIRQITPIHLTDNAFGGTAIYMRFLDALNVVVTGRHYEVEDGWDQGIRYRLDHDGGLKGDFERTVAGSGPKLSPRPALNRKSLMYGMEGAGEMDTAAAPAMAGRAHANIRGLTVYGMILLEEMVARGMIIDVDHMSQKSVDTALNTMESLDYPVVSSHSWFRDLAFSADVEFDPRDPQQYGTGNVHRVAHENAKSGEQVERIARLGGVMAPILCQGDVRPLGRAIPELDGKVPQQCSGSGTNWAEAYLYVAAKTGGRGVAIGSDINGAADLPGPRFGPLAAYESHLDPGRVDTRRDDMAAQKNGVALRHPDSRLSLVPLRRERRRRLRRRGMRHLGRDRRVQGRFQPGERRAPARGSAGAGLQDRVPPPGADTRTGPHRQHCDGHVGVRPGARERAGRRPARLAGGAAGRVLRAARPGAAGWRIQGST